VRLHTGHVEQLEGSPCIGLAVLSSAGDKRRRPRKHYLGKSKVSSKSLRQKLVIDVRTSESTSWPFLSSGSGDMQTGSVVIIVGEVAYG